LALRYWQDVTIIEYPNRFHFCLNKPNLAFIGKLY
jgi:hypothetical protein